MANLHKKQQQRQNGSTNAAATIDNQPATKPKTQTANDRPTKASRPRRCA